MQKTILLLGLLIAPTAVMAQSEVCSSSYTIATVTVSSFAATNVDSTQMFERKFVQVQNVSTDTVRCAGANVTTSTGLLLAASGGSWSLNLGDTSYSIAKTTYTPYYVNTAAPMKLYCIGNGTNISSKVAVVQCK